MAYLSRRHFMTGAGAVGFTASIGALSSIGAQRAWAADTSGYKAMVCLFLKGGMDQADTVLPYDQTSYDQLANVRSSLFQTYNAGSGTSTRNRANLLRLNADNGSAFGGREFALPTELAPLHDMFEAGDLAVLGNVGPLIEPTTRAQMQNSTAILPKRLFSHNDQQSTWMSLKTEGQKFGWGGRFLDALLASSPSTDPLFTAIATGSNDVFLSGTKANPFRLSSNGAPQPHLLDRTYYLGNTEADNEARRKLKAFLERRDLGDNNVYAQDLRDNGSRAIDLAEQLSQARQTAGEFAAEFGADPISRQLKSVAETIKIQQALNVPRQMFYVTTGRYDTHNTQANVIGENHSALAAAIRSFKTAMQEIGQWDNVVIFTMSDFGRTLIDNGDGTDHGWGGHHFIAGGQVRGRRIYGDMPSPEVGSQSYTPDRGRLIASTSVEQYAATLGSWFGLTNSELRDVLPNLGNFDSQNLGFMNGRTA